MIHRDHTSRVLVVAAILVVVIAASPALAKKDKKVPIEKYRAVAMSVERGNATHLDIVIYGFTTADKRQEMIQTLREDGNVALYKWMQNQDEMGYLRTGGSLAYELRYIYEFTKEDGTRQIVAGADRPLGFMEVARNARTSDHSITLMYLELDPETNKGEGKLVAGAEVGVDKKTGQLKFEIMSHNPAQLNDIQPLKIK